MKTLTCYIVGEGSLPLQCAELLLTGGHVVAGVISSDPGLRRWAQEHAITQIAPGDAFETLRRAAPFDYLFSIVNHSVLPAALLALPQGGAINYHDSPLPRYAGMHATSWALLAGETQHGVTWHLMERGIDTGPILCQHTVPIAPDDTALTLNAKCYAAALASFATLIDDLARDRFAPQPQNQAARTYFARYLRPPAAAMLSWQHTAARSEALVRALHFGPYPNPLGLPKFALGQTFVAVSEAAALAWPTDAPPGSVLDVGPDAISVATTNGALALQRLLTLDGQPLALADAVTRYDLRPGSMLADLDPARAERLTAMYSETCKHEPYWVKRLATLQPVTLPYGNSTPITAPTGCIRLPIVLPVELVLPNHSDLLLAAFTVYLARISGSYRFDLWLSDSTLRHELSSFTELFATAVPVPVELESAWPMTHTCDVLHALIARARRHGTFARDVVARYPILRDVPPAARNSSTDWLDLKDDETALACDGLALVLNGDSCAWLYDPQRFETVTINRMLSQFSTLLTGIAATPASPVAHLPLLNANEWQAAVVAPHQVRSFPSEQPLHALFEGQAAHRPDAVALVYEDQQLSYSALNARANQLAHHLRAHGVGPETIVALLLERSLDLVVGILAILKAGAAYLPLDPAYPAERLTFMLSDSGAAVLVTSDTLKQFAVGSSQSAVNTPLSAQPPSLIARLKLVYIDADWPRIANEPTNNPAPLAAADNLAYVIYTSGSTGQPKGVLVTHRNVARLFTATAAWFAFDQRDVWTLFHSAAFDFSVWELWGALLHGGRLVVVPYLTSRAPEAFYELLRQERVTVLNQTPSAFRGLMRAEEERGAAADLALRIVIFGGEALEPGTLAPWVARHGDDQPHLVNMYGITETTVHVTYRPISAADIARGVGSVIGAPIPDLALYLLDAHGEPVPVGVHGELYVGGAGLARGYLNRPELTAERFVEQLWTIDEGQSSQRLYRTGDLVRRLPDGDIEYLGRIDHQVKIRGFRIELGEIEAALNRHPDVRESLVLAREDTPGVRRLVAYIVPNHPVAATTLPPADQHLPTELRSLLQTTLPDHMLPAAFVSLARLPLTSNGKIDRQALPPPNHARPALAENFVTPLTPAEGTLAGIWAEALGLERVGRHDNFFELGGDSIISIQIIARAAQVGLRVTLKQLFEHQTVAGVAEVAVVDNSATVARAEQGLVTGEVPLTPIQRWFFEQRLPEPHHWNQALLLQLCQPLDPTLLEAALRALVSHHDALRLRFERRTDGWRQWNAAASDIGFMRVQLAALPEGAQQATFERVAAQVQTSMDLQHGPLLQAALLARDGDSPSQLLIAIHHLAVDGVSWRILLEDLQTAYRQLAAGEPVRLPSKTSAFRQWAEALEHYARSVELAVELDYWREAIPANALLSNISLPNANSEAAAATVSVALDAAETRALLRDAPAAFAAQINDLLLTALARAWTSQFGSALLIDLEGHGREEIIAGIDLSRTVGWFTTIFPVLLDISRSHTPRETVQLVQAQLRAIPQRGISYGLLRYLGSSDASAALRDLPQATLSFNYLGQFDGALAPLFAPAMGSVGPLHSPQGQRRYLLEVNGSVMGGRLRVEWTYNPQIHGRGTIERLARTFAAELRGLTAAARDTAPANTAQVLHTQQPAIEQDYPLGPAQTEMLAHARSEPTWGVYLLQWTCLLTGALDPHALWQAWARVVERHPILRSAFNWQNVPTPSQYVQQHAAPVWAEHDWRAATPEQQGTRLDALLRDDRACGFDLTRPPLLRLTLLRLDDNRYRLLWTIHHLLLDGWSARALLDEVFALYTALSAGTPAPTTPVRPPYRNYITWLHAQDLAQAEAFWRATLRGYRGQPALARDRVTPEQPAGRDERTVRLPVATTAALQARAGTQRLTLNTLVQAAWALALSHTGGGRDIVFGATVSGRTLGPAGIEHIIGPCINTLPVRVRIDPQQPLLAWLRALQVQQVESRQFEYTPPALLHAWSELPSDQPLFESILRFQNFPSAGALGDKLGDLEASDGRWIDWWHYPICLVALPGDRLELAISYDRRRFAPASIDALLAQLQALLERFVAQLELA